MSPSSTPTLEIGFDPACVEHREDLLALVVEREEADRRAAAKTRRHLARCRRCQETHRALQIQRSAVRSWRPRGWESQGVAQPVPLAARAFERWLDRALGEYRVESLAHAAWRFAHALAFTDRRLASVASPLMDLRDPRSLVEIHRSADADIDEMEAPTSRRPPGLHTGPLRRLFMRFGGAAGSLSPADRIELARSIVTLVDRDLGAAPGHATLLRGSIEWVHGDATAVPRWMGLVATHGRDVSARADALTALAVHACDRGDVARARRFLNAAAIVCPTNPNAIRQRVIWETLSGHEAAAQRSMTRLLSVEDGHALAEATSIRRLWEIARNVAEVLELPARTAAIRTRRLTELFGAPRDPGRASEPPIEERES